MDRFLSEQEAERERPLPRGVRVRRGTEEDEYATFEVMRRSMGYEMLWPHHIAIRNHLRQTPQASYWVAEETPRFGATRILGYARALTRERVWNLTEFFVLPGHHRKGIGGALLARCLEDSQRFDVDTRYVLASQHPSADALYIRRAGCYPRLPMLLLSGPLRQLRLPIGSGPPILDVEPPQRFDDLPGRAAAVHATQLLRAEPLRPTPAVQAELDALDREIVGYARPQEHRHWSAAADCPGGAARLFRRVTAPEATSGPLVGYAYLGPHFTGPALARADLDLPPILAHVAALALTGAPAMEQEGFFLPTEHYLAVAGTNTVMLRWLLDCGWQILFQYLFMSSRPFGQFDRYVCYNPLYVL